MAEEAQLGQRIAAGDRDDSGWNKDLRGPPLQRQRVGHRHGHVDADRLTHRGGKATRRDRDDP